MDSYALLALQIVNTEATSALPNAPVVPDRPSLLDRIADGLAAARRGFYARELRVPAEAALPKRTEVRRAA
ncbi:hypothetical protein [Glycomyces paridis]|uniref:Uncharacterized protein n=1 Tax=Glycomyces paridis TaxID=2126555 RepID=A0A4S8PEQ1_9ACTN|nr:hypothetical protein [Glycomyces paridis]THV28075.1 hypothetical protein E9998_13990 [Glycomyces paridis]